MTAASGSVLNTGMRRAGWTVVDLWLAGVALGGVLSRDEISEALGGTTTMRASDYDVLATALNERLDDAGLDDPVPYTTHGRTLPPG